MHRQLVFAAACRAAAVAGLFGATLLCADANAHAQSTAEAQILSEAITFRLNKLRSGSANRIVVDIAAARDTVDRATARHVAQLLGGTLRNLSELMTCPKEPVSAPVVTLDDCSLPDGTIVFVIERPVIHGDTAVVTLLTYQGTNGVHVDSFTLQMVREIGGWRFSKIIGRGAS